MGEKRALASPPPLYNPEKGLGFGLSLNIVAVIIISFMTWMHLAFLSDLLTANEIRFRV